MERVAFPMKLYFLISAALLWALLAYLSRYETCLPIRAIFKAIEFGKVNLIEHFVAGFAVPAAFVAILPLSICYYI